MGLESDEVARNFLRKRLFCQTHAIQRIRFVKFRRVCHFIDSWTVIDYEMLYCKSNQEPETHSELRLITKFCFWQLLQFKSLKHMTKLLTIHLHQKTIKLSTKLCPFYQIKASHSIAKRTKTTQNLPLTEFSLTSELCNIEMQMWMRKNLSSPFLKSSPLVFMIVMEKNFFHSLCAHSLINGSFLPQKHRK